MRTGTLLIVDDEQSARTALGELLKANGHKVYTASDGYKALGLFKQHRPDVVLTDLRMPMMDGIELIHQIKVEYPQTPCVVMTAFGSIENAVEAMKRGADDYMTKPLNIDEVELIIERKLERVELLREVNALRAATSVAQTQRILGNSDAIQHTVKFIKQVAPSSATILITGESGTGKELAAQALHQASGRGDGPMIAVHCAALPDSLLESELFGHEKGAFTGASKTHIGYFERAHNGTLFLDEIGEISPSVQVKLLRFLQTNQLQRVGGERPIDLNVRILTATNRDLEKEVREGRFREDLYYRINVIDVHMPPLRTREDDVVILAHYFVQKYAARNHKTIRVLSQDFLLALTNYQWPGNVRQLENIMERAVVLAMGDTLEREHLPTRVLQDADIQINKEEQVRIPGSSLEQLERHAIMRTYEHFNGDSKRTATMLGISQRKVQYKIRAYIQDEQVVEPE